jgi:hypothetical protein
MKDVFGNYVVQKLFEHGTQPQKQLLADRMQETLVSLSVDQYGCRVVQKVTPLSLCPRSYPFSLANVS